MTQVMAHCQSLHLQSIDKKAAISCKNDTFFNKVKQFINDNT